jgi:predicted GIY-YIG superfamily endonuclease
MYCVYWIKKETHQDITSEGYVGISKNFEERMRAHRKNKKKTPLTDAIKSIGWTALDKRVLATRLSQQEALLLEHRLRPIENIGWNLQRGGELGVDPFWYAIQDNQIKHSLATSKGTKEGIQKKDSPSRRRTRALLSREKNKESYVGIAKGEKNPRAILTEEQVFTIKYDHIPSGKGNMEIAVLYDVKPYVISFIRTGKNWKHI